MSKTTPKLDIDRTRERLLQLGCSYAGGDLEMLLAEAVKQPIAAHEFLDRLLEIEITGRDIRRIATMLRASNLPPGQTLANFDFAFQPAIERSRIDTLATSASVRGAETRTHPRTPWSRQDSPRSGARREGHRAGLLGAVLPI